MPKLKALLLLLLMISICMAKFEMTTVQPGSRSADPELENLYGEAFNRSGFLTLSKSRSDNDQVHSALMNEDTLTFNLFNDLTVEAKKTKVNTTPDGGLFWKGDLVAGEDGYMVLFYSNGLLTGTLYSSDVVYNLNGLDNNTIRVVESDPTRIPVEHKECDHDDDTLEPYIQPLVLAPASETRGTVIDVMVLYPSSVQSQMGGASGMANEVKKRVAEMNDVYNNSNVNITYNLVYHGVASTMNANAQKAGDVGNNSEVKRLREQYKADVVSFWSGSGGSAGNGFNLDGGGHPSNGFNTSKFSLVQTYYTFIHECGHNMGAKHDRAAYSSKPYKLELTPYYRYGKSFSNYRSVMSYNNCTSGGSCPRVPYFTNPDINVKGAPFGVQGTSQSYDKNGPANNSRRLNETASIVAAWMKGTAVQTYSLAVHSGIGDGNYKSGVSVTITANDAPYGKEFSHWSGDTQYLANANAATTKVTMPSKNVDVTANYKTIAVSKYTLTVNSGTGDGSYEEGAAVTVKAATAPAGKEFSSWSGDVTYLADKSAATTTLTMPGKNVTITANYTTVAAETFALTVNEGTGDGNFEAGEVITITANDSSSVDRVFLKWSGDVTYIKSVTSATTTVTMPSKAIEVTALYEEPTPLDTSNLSVNLVDKAGWDGGHDDYGSAIDIDSSKIQSESIVSAAITSATDNSAAEEYAWVKMSGYLDSLFTDVTVFKLTYKSDKAVKFVLEQEILSDSGVAYYHELPATGSSEKTLFLQPKNFSQTSWEGSLVGQLKLDKVNAVSFEAIEKGKTTNFSLSEMKFTNYPYDAVALTGSAVVAPTQINVNGLSRNSLTLSTPHSGDHKITIRSFAGRILFEQNLSLAQGVKTIPVNSLTAGVYLISVQGNGFNKVFKSPVY